MKTFKNIFIVLTLCLVYSSCKDNPTGPSGNGQLSFDYIGTSNSVYYNRSYIIDSLGRKLWEYRDTIFVNIKVDTNKIGVFNNSIVIEHNGRIRDSNNNVVNSYSAKDWYAQSNDTVYRIAYSGSSSGNFFLKTSARDIKTTFFDFKNPFTLFAIDQASGVKSDSIPKYAVYSLPFAINKEWQCFPSTWVIQRKKKVEGIESITTPTGTFSCYKIHTSLLSQDFRPEEIWYDYVSREGLILRTMKIEVQISTEQNPDGGERATYYSRLELVSIK